MTSKRLGHPCLLPPIATAGTRSISGAVLDRLLTSASDRDRPVWEPTPRFQTDSRPSRSTGQASRSQRPNFRFHTTGDLPCRALPRCLHPLGTGVGRILGWAFCAMPVPSDRAVQASAPTRRALTNKKSQSTWRLALFLSVPSIHQSLTESAKRYAFLAANEFVAGDRAACALAAGVAVEHALKARIAAESPVFLAVGRNDDAWFRSARKLLTYAEDAVAFDAVSGDVQTLGGSQALTRAFAIDSTLKPLDVHVRRVFQCRNGQAHMGMAGTEEMKVVFASCAKAVTEILGLRAEFWGPHANMVDSLLDDLATELRQRVEVKLAAARTEFERRFGSETALVRSTLIRQIESARSWQYSDEVRPYECPVCGSGALIQGTNHVEVEYDRHTDYPAETVVLDATRFVCEACRLVLDGADELEAVGIDPEMENEGVNPGDVYGDFEPDEDWFRDK